MRRGHPARRDRPLKGLARYRTPSLVRLRVNFALVNVSLRILVKPRRFLLCGVTAIYLIPQSFDMVARVTAGFSDIKFSSHIYFGSPRKDLTAFR